MVLITDKCHFMCLSKDMENETFNFDNFIFSNKNEERILGITIDSKLFFKKSGALSRLLNHLNDSHKKLIFNSKLKLQFNYSPLIWMFFSKTSNNMIN